MPEPLVSTDGAIDRMLRLGQRQKHVPAIFVHAGAGFHSHQNEHVHLQACVAAAEMGMKFLRAGATATEAVEAALRILEDKEITNAGYGSNLSIDGTVECDATIVDHLGRSGACGAVPSVRNPISLAKLILDTSTQPLTLRRVPPNALVGEGAKAFAEEHGIITFTNDHLISKNARDRFIRWQDDLKRAESKLKETKPAAAPAQAPFNCAPCHYDTASPSDPQKTFPRDHTAAIMAGTWNEGQPDSPYVGTPTSEGVSTPDSPMFFRAMNTSPTTSGAPPLRPSLDRPPISPGSSISVKEGAAVSLLGKVHIKAPNVSSRGMGKTHGKSKANADLGEAHRDGSASPVPSPEGRSGSMDKLLPNDGPRHPRGVKRPQQTKDGPTLEPEFKRPTQQFRLDGREDSITDTIGAIAIDERGHIAAGSSSGGIGMKHRGRLGPAALVGVGTAVVPFAEGDEDEVTVAAVTSGTGEHMATTMASQRCAERIYHGTRRGPRGADVQDDDEDAIMESFIVEDFMGHPGVKYCHSAGAIGVMVVKKSHSGYYLYFAHNTDSFALASMGALEREPRCTMSRLPEGAKIARGGRKVRIL
ncbi:nucleophile aminohydrolase [Stachybotrys elegans]|uniref:Nucleophile aminohydrolase n=1 Tax=Stachybotrys elegans TaxID=80388 RepID=A0A8K0SP52_9HYPO|nr:nucleophile aminohydrolase [Stachybotrys elegans]